MMSLPFQILGLWFRGLLSIAILAGGIYLARQWYDDSNVTVAGPNGNPPATARDLEIAPDRNQPADPARGREVLRKAESTRRVFRFEPGWNQPTAELAGALALLIWATSGLFLARGLSSLSLRRGIPSERSTPRPDATSAGMTEPEEDPSSDRTGEVHLIRRPDGSEIRVESYGPPDAQPIIWTHGWGANSTEWFYQKRNLAGRFRLIVWDEPGLGLSKKPDNNDYRLEKMAADLDAVLIFAGPRPSLLVGHSIGGMITLTYCRLYPESLGTRVSGLVLAHTSYTNPVRTTRWGSFYTAIEKPVLIPLLYLTIGLWPMAWLMNWMSYLNGSAHRSTHKTSFSGHETKGQLDFVAGLMPLARPDVLARGMLGMIAYDATSTLERIPVPTLVFVGDKDTTTLPEAGAFIASHIPDAELVQLSPARHMGLLEHHDQFDRRVVDFAARCETVSARV